eukprot:COSAG06_NODE_18865_length_864_cov_1.623529_1_plen_112_part_00
MAGGEGAAQRPTVRHKLDATCTTGPVLPAAGVRNCAELSLQLISWPCCEPCAGALTPRQKGVLGWSEAIVLPRTAHSWLAQAPGFLQPFWSQLAACTRVPSVVPLFTMSRQ